MRRGNAWVRYVWLAAVLYMFFTVGRLAYRNYELNQEEAELRTSIAVLENEVQDLKNKIIYYQSDSYKEKMLRARLNLKKEGESVIVITPEPEVEEVVIENTKDIKNNPQKWLSYFFPS
ncbi:MAG: septum formation initiator family protein [Patescibacteria group bacterium]|nr:septum formation initiator family protein [Patescibacteria group bacterium]